MAKTWTGTLTKLQTVSFSKPAGKWSNGFSGEATVYRFVADDPKCKVVYVATFTGVEHETVCSASGDIGQAIMKAACIDRIAKNSSLSGEQDTFPQPIGCGADNLSSRARVQTLTFFRKV